MAARPQGLSAGLLTAAAMAAALCTGAPVSGQSPAPAARRIVSLVPALTEMLFAIGAGPRVVGVSSFDEFPPEVKSLPRVGALLDPDTERVLALRPDLVILYGSQSDLQSQLDRAGIRTVGYRHGGIAATFETLRELGARTGHQVQARALVSRLEKELAGIHGRVAARPRPRTLLVIGRQPGTLREVYASGGVGFLHEMLEIAGGVNVFGDVPRESVQPSLETILARAPDVILEVRAAAPANPDAERDVWSLIASVPAVRTGRVHLLAGDYLVVPGPRLASATEALGRVLHPDSFK